MMDAVAASRPDMDPEQAKRLRAKNLRTGLILAALAVGFVVVLVLRRM
ncbi:MAG: hypothetical protein ABI771_02755 [Betaproteobacteria bacterium]